MAFEKGKSGNPDKMFQPGQSGNPNGRPAIPDLKELIQENIPAEDFAAILKKLTLMAKNGNVKAAQDLLDRAFGKASQSINHNVKGEMLNVNLTDVAPDDIKSYRDAIEKEY